MLETIFETFYFISKIAYFCLIFSYKAGRVIVTALTVLFEVIVLVGQSLQNLTNILFEDFRLFWCDIRQLVTSCISIITTITQTFVNILVVIVNTIKTSVLVLVDGIIGVYNGVFIFVDYVLALLAYIIVSTKQWLVLLGSGVWFVISLLPLFVMYISTISTYYVGLLFTEVVNITSCVIHNSKSAFVNGYNFVSDFPLDSLLGLIIGFSAVYAVFKMQLVLYQQALFCMHLIRSFLARIQLLMYRRVVHTETGNHSDIDESDNEFHVKNNFCIICQEQDKCILMLPCRHLCVCNTCNIRLQRYDRTCPICRTMVQRTMKVFT